MRNGQIVHTVDVKHATPSTKRLSLILQDDVDIFIKKDRNNESIESNIELNSNLKAPIKAGTVVGKIVYTNGDINYEYNLIAESDVKYNYVLVGIIIAGIILVLVFFIRIIFK